MKALLKDAMTPGNNASRLNDSSTLTASCLSSPSCDLAPSGAESKLPPTIALGDTGDNSLTVAKLLKAAGLESLQEMFNKEQITVDVLAEMGHDELKDIGVTAYGHRYVLKKNSFINKIMIH